ncbi:hypothetical protein GIB67_001695 [Kingdonia uniflora]|uniref:Uncharacterized protein n=1 Tax=Kingdonia uniflora TaxID=39325 RepID=A0A7J7LMK5_9MAGN|nr:hypothetical protein GIB67_001695 [Kingdonia uniflora]
MEIHHWVTYLVPENVVSYKQLKPTSSNNSKALPEISKLDQLLVEAWEVLSSADFMNLMEVLLRSVVDALIEEMGLQFTRSGIPLANLLPLLAQMSPLLLEEPSKNKYLSIIRSLSEVKLFYTLLY